MPGPTTSPSPAAAPQGGPRRLFSEYFWPLVWALALSAVLKAGVVEAYHIPSGSMLPTLLVGDRVLVNKLAYDLRLPFTHLVLAPLGEPQRGDILVFDPPPGMGPDVLIKRLVGLPGETVALRHKQVFINGLPLADPWGHPGSLPGPADDFGPVTVPAGHYFMLGDNRDNSLDSRLWNQGRGGFVARQDIEGKAWLLLWSWDQAAWRPRWGRSLGSLG